METETYVKIESCPQFVKDTSSGAILNTDKGALQAYKTRRKMMRELNSSTNRVSELENRLDRIEQLLMKVLEK